MVSTMVLCIKSDLDRDLDHNLDRVQKMYPFTQDIYCSIQQSVSHCCLLLSHCYNAIHIECLHGTKFLDPDHDLDCDPDNFASYKTHR